MKTTTTHTQAPVKAIKASHTPGPWRSCFVPAADAYPCGRLEVRGPAQSSACIAKVTFFPIVPDEFPQDKRSEIGEANAKLIAAAPELLEALLKIAEREGNAPKYDRRESSLIARAAIAKATE